MRQVVQGPVSDYDAVSLYPSSMWRLGQDLGGMPMGMARMIPTPINWPLDYQYYVVRIRILAITKWQQMPMVSLKTKGKVKYFSIFYIVSHLNFVVGRITLEDWIRFCGIKFDILEGLYWDGGFNSKIMHTVDQLFSLRKRLKEQESEVVKLIMNSGYGTLILKKRDRSVAIKGREEALDYASDRYGVFKQMVEFGEHCEITIAEYDDSFTRNHLGAAILEMSKRIMDEILDLCTRHSINVYYVDTDSMHIDTESLPSLELSYRLEYREN